MVMRHEPANVGGWKPSTGLTQIHPQHVPQNIPLVLTDRCPTRRVGPFRGIISPVPQADGAPSL